MKTEGYRARNGKHKCVGQDTILPYCEREMLYNCPIMKLGIPRLYYYARP